ncbi:MAG: VanZ family protein [Zavarzinella sp.]
MKAPFPQRHHYAFASIAFALFIVYGSLVPFEAISLSFSTARIQFAEAMRTTFSFESRSDWVANILLYIPLGFVGCAALMVDRRHLWAPMAVIAAVFVICMGVEFAQLWFPMRTTSVNDVIANTVGGGIGAVGWCLYGQNVTERMRTLWTTSGREHAFFRIIPFYLLFLIAVNGMPFDLSISPTELWYKYKAGRIQWFPPVGFLEKLLVIVAYFAPIGWMWARFTTPKWGDNFLYALGIGFACATLLELVQLSVLSCGTYLSDVIAGTGAVLLGWQFARTPLIVSRYRIFFALLWCVALATVHWYGRIWVGTGWLHWKFEEIFWVPFTDYFRSHYLTAFGKIVDRTMVMIVLGVLLHRKSGWAWTSLIVGTIALLLECGLLFMGNSPTSAAFLENPFSPIPSTSKVELGFIGGGIGGWLALRWGNRSSVVQQAPPKQPQENQRPMYAPRWPGPRPQSAN